MSRNEFLRRLKTVLIAGLALVATGCASEDPVAAPPITLTPQQAQSVAAIGANMTGLGLEQSEWETIALDACRRGAWNWAVSRQIGQSLEVPPEFSENGATAAAAVWLMAIEVCRDRFPAEAIEQGPPGANP